MVRIQLGQGRERDKNVTIFGPDMTPLSLSFTGTAKTSPLYRGVPACTELPLQGRVKPCPREAAWPWLGGVSCSLGKVHKATFASPPSEQVQLGSLAVLVVICWCINTSYKNK